MKKNTTALFFVISSLLISGPLFAGKKKNRKPSTSQLDKYTWDNPPKFGGDSDTQDERRENKAKKLIMDRDRKRKAAFLSGALVKSAGTLLEEDERDQY